MNKDNKKTLDEISSVTTYNVFIDKFKSDKNIIKKQLRSITLNLTNHDTFLKDQA